MWRRPTRPNRIYPRSSVSKRAVNLHRRPARLASLTGALLLGILFLRYFRHIGRSPASAAASLPGAGPPPAIPAGFRKSSFDWSSFRHAHPPPTPLKPLPSGRPRRLPRVQHDFAAGQDDHDDDNDDDNDAAAAAAAAAALTRERREAVRAAFMRSYESYKKYAWMHDELTPVTARAKDPFGGYAATLIDSLDTLYIMGLRDEFAEAVAAVAQLDWDATAASAINVFETTIRHLGGLLAAYDLSGEPALLAKAVELGDMLYAAFDTPNRMPPFWLAFRRARAGIQLAGERDPSAAPSSLSLEFTRLAQLTGEAKYYDAIDRVTRLLGRTQWTTRLPGMWPRTIDFRRGAADGDTAFSLGALADSLYEYLPKMHALLGGLEPAYEALYRGAVDTAVRHLLFRPMLPDRADVLFAGDAHVDPVTGAVERVPEVQHLSCFAGGMLALGGRLVGNESHVAAAGRLARGCAWAYGAFPAGVMPEVSGMVPCETLEACDWDEALWERAGDKRLPEGFRHARDPRYVLRPEAIESVFLLYRVTGDDEFREMAWRMFTAVRDATETPYAYSAIRDVRARGATEKLDSMESFWMAETLKYFYLIFSPPDLISLDEYVLNTEAHPLRRPV